MINSFRYSDKLLWVLFYPIIALSFIFIANDNPFHLLIKLPSFKTDFLFALAVTFIVGLYLKWITHKLDKTIPRANFKERLKKQFIKGFIFPLIVSMLLELIYLYLINIPLSESSILNLELPLTILFLLLINFFYLGTYLYHNKIKEVVTIIEKESQETEFVKFIFVQKGYSEEKVDIENCAFIKSSAKVLWLHTLNGETYRLNGTLEDWETKLAPTFFKINRQYLATARSIESIEHTDTRKIKVLFGFQQEEDVFVSKANATSFKKWWKKDSPSQ
jgi:uncharacterized RDD family membrane protein YckC